MPRNRSSSCPCQRKCCIGSLVEDTGLEDLGILSWPCTPCWALYLVKAWKSHVSMSSAAREAAGMPQVALVDAMTKMPSQALRRGEMTVTPNKRHCGREEEPLHREHLGSVPWENPPGVPSNATWAQGSQPLNGCKIWSLSIFLFLFFLIKMAILSCCSLASLSYWDPERILYHLPPSPGAKLIQKVNKKKNSWATWPTYHLFQYFHYFFSHSALT